MPEFEEILKRNFTLIDDAYTAFATEKNACRQCEMYDCYKQTAQSEGGAVKPTFMFIGEAYGSSEQAQVRPFIGKAGQRLREEIRKHKQFNRQNTILSNVLSCRPKDNKFPEVLRGAKGSVKDKVKDLVWAMAKLDANSPVKYKFWEDNQRTEEDETSDIGSVCASKWLFREIGILQPKVIVTLGATPLKYVCGQTGVTEKRGEWMFSSRFRAWVLPTFHPSYVLRCVNDPAKSFVAHYFEQDIAKVANTWHTIVASDYRMRMDPEDWRRQSSLMETKDKMHVPNGKIH